MPILPISSLRAAVTNAGGTPTQYTHVGLLRELITAWGGTPTQWAINPLLREAISAASGTPTKHDTIYLLRELVTALGGTPTGFNGGALWDQVASLSASIGGSPVNTVAPSISGTRGGTLTATPGTWTGATSVSGQWYADGAATGNTTTSFTDSDTSKSLEYRETALPGSVVASGYLGTQTSTLTPVQFDPAASSLALSNSNLTGTSTASSFQLARSSITRATGYFEVTVNHDPGGFTHIGLSSSTQPSTDWLGSGASSIGYRSSGAVVKGAATIATYATYTDADVIGVAVKAGKVYFSKNGAWQGGADPVAGTGGLDITSITNPWPACGSSFSGAVFTANFAPAANAPSGIPTWDTNPTATATIVVQPSTAPGNKQVTFTGINLPAGSTGAQYKIETEAGQFVQGWTTATFSSGIASGAYPIPQFAFEGQKLKVLLKNVGGTVQTIGALTATNGYVMTTPMRVGMNDEGWFYYTPQIPGRDWFTSAHLSWGVMPANPTTSDRQKFLPPNMVQNNYNHWAEAYSPTQVYPSANGETSNFRMCRYQGLNWKTVDTTSQTRPAPSTADPTGATTGWNMTPIGGGADASLCGMNGDNTPTKLPDDTNLTIFCDVAWAPPTGSAPFTVVCKTQPGIAVKLYANSLGTLTLTQSPADIAAGQFTLNYLSPAPSGYNGILYIDRANSTATLNSSFFISGIPSYETGTPSADIGGPYASAAKLSDFTPFAGGRFMKPQPIEKFAGDWTGTFTAATNTLGGVTRLWQYMADTANRLNWKYLHICVPSGADTSFVTAMATFFRDNLNVGIKAHPELSNEDWNGQYLGAQELTARAAALVNTDAAYNKPYLLHCREHNAMVAIWKSVFGAAYATRVAPILAWQSVTAISTWQQMLDFENTWQNVGRVSIAPYADSGIGDWTGSPNVAWEQDQVIAAVGASNQANFNTHLSNFMTHAADYEVGLCQALFNFLPGYSMSKGLGKDAIQMDYYEAGWFTTTNTSGWDAAFGAGAGNRAISYFDQWKRSAAGGTWFAYYIDQIAQKAPGTMNCFVYITGNILNMTNSWGLMDKQGLVTQEPYATVKAKALAYN